MDSILNAVTRGWALAGPAAGAMRGGRAEFCLQRCALPAVRRAAGPGNCSGLLWKPVQGMIPQAFDFQAVCLRPTDPVEVKPCQ